MKIAPFVYVRRMAYQPIMAAGDRYRRCVRMPISANGEGERLLTPAEVAALFRVDPKTVTRWAKAGKLSSIRTLGGHRRYWETEVRRLLERSAAS